MGPPAPRKSSKTAAQQAKAERKAERRFRRQLDHEFRKYARSNQSADADSSTPASPLNSPEAALEFLQQYSDGFPTIDDQSPAAASTSTSSANKDGDDEDPDDEDSPPTSSTNKDGGERQDNDSDKDDTAGDSSSKDNTDSDGARRPRSILKNNRAAAVSNSEDESQKEDESDADTENEDDDHEVKFAGSTKSRKDGTPRLHSSYAKKVKDFQSLEQHVASSITVKLKKKDRAVLMQLAAQLDTFAQGAQWFYPAACFKIGSETFNIFRDIISVSPDKVYAVAKHRGRTLADVGAEEYFPYFALRYVLTQKVAQPLLDKAFRILQSERAEGDGQALWMALVRLHFPSTSVFATMVRDVLDKSKLSDFADLDQFIEHIHRYLQLAPKETAKDFISHLFEKLLQHECQRFTKRISKRYDEWMDEELEK